MHSLGLPSLLSDPSAKTPEEALVHIFSEARRTTPSILYLPQFDVWWETVSISWLPVIIYDEPILMPKICISFLSGMLILNYFFNMN